jgi:hypothetical protein
MVPSTSVLLGALALFSPTPTRPPASPRGLEETTFANGSALRGSGDGS